MKRDFSEGGDATAGAARSYWAARTKDAAAGAARSLLAFGELQHRNLFLRRGCESRSRAADGGVLKTKKGMPNPSAPAATPPGRSALQSTTLRSLQSPAEEAQRAAQHVAFFPEKRRDGRSSASARMCVPLFMCIYTMCICVCMCVNK